MFPCSADHVQDWQAYPQLPPVIGVPRVCCGHASGIYFPRLLWFGGCATHVTQCSVPGYSYFTMCSEKSEHNCVTSYWYTAAILARFLFFSFACLRRCFSLNLSNRNQKKKNGNQQKTRLEASKPPTVFTTALKKNLNASRPSEHPSIRWENVKTFRWDHNRPQIQNLFMAFKRVPR